MQKSAVPYILSLPNTPEIVLMGCEPCVLYLCDLSILCDHVVYFLIFVRLYVCVDPSALVGQSQDRQRANGERSSGARRRGRRGGRFRE